MGRREEGGGGSKGLEGVIFGGVSIPPRNVMVDIKNLETN